VAGTPLSQTKIIRDLYHEIWALGAIACGVKLYLHAVPWLFAVSILGRLLVHAVFGLPSNVRGTDAPQLILWHLGHITFGIAVVIAFGIAFNIAGRMATGIAFGIAAGIAFGIAGGIATGMTTGIAIGIAFGIAGGSPSESPEESPEESPQESRRNRRSCRLRSRGGIAFGIDFGIALLRVYYHLPNILFVWPKPMRAGIDFTRRLDDMCSVPFPAWTACWSPMPKLRRKRASRKSTA